MPAPDRFVLGLDLDGTCADFYGKMREIAAEWTGSPLEQLPLDAEWGLDSWGIGEEGYPRFHRFAVTQRALFESMKPLKGAPQAIRRLGTEGIRIRIITHRLSIRYFHETAVAQTVRWLDKHGIPYWDLCFMRRKGEVGADLYVEDSPENVEDLVALEKDVLILSNSANSHLQEGLAPRAADWSEAEAMIRDRYYAWLDARALERPPGPGCKPSWARAEDEPVV